MTSQVGSSSRLMAGGFFIALTLLLSFSLGNPASAAPMWDYVDIVVPSGQWATAADPVVGTFDITVNEGDCYMFWCDIGEFDPDTQDVNDAQMVFLLLDNASDQSDVAIIDLGDLFDEDITVNGDDQIFGGFFFDVYLENIEGNVNVFAQLSDTGTIGWKVAPTDGNRSVVVAAAALGANAVSAGSHDVVASVPEPGAALLFCAGFGVVGVATRKPRTH